MKTLYTQHTSLPPEYLASKILEFLKEDRANNDLTTQISTLNKLPIKKAYLIAEQELVFAGEPIVNHMLTQCKINTKKHDGETCYPGDVIATVCGKADLLLSNERVLLNLIQRLSGIASLTKKYVTKLNNQEIKILDTRKTTPGIRLFEKYAVNIGGGYNHRMDLFDGTMFKDNHLTILKDMNYTLTSLRQTHPNKKIQIEVDTFSQLNKILQSTTINLDAILLDNMSIDETKRCIDLIRNKLPLCFIESSGGINLQSISKYRKIDVDGISVGGLTHQAVSKNIKFEFE